jgi:hypothetical protein
MPYKNFSKNTQPLTCPTRSTLIDEPSTLSTKTHKFSGQPLCTHCFPWLLLNSKTQNIESCGSSERATVYPKFALLKNIAIFNSLIEAKNICASYLDYPAACDPAYPVFLYWAVSVAYPVHLVRLDG